MTLSNAADRKDLRRLEKAAKELDRQRAEVIRALMDTTAGRAYVWSELVAAHVFATSFSLEPLQMAFTEGERNTGLRLIDTIMDNCPDEFLLMWRESSAREHSREQPRSPDGNGSDSESGSDDAGSYDTGDDASS